MTDVLAPSAVELIAGVAAAAAAALPSGSTLHPGEPSREFDADELFGQAVGVTFSGSLSGELIVVIGRSLATALTDGDVDPAQALAPTVQAAAATLGPVALGEITVSETAVALEQILQGDTDGFVVPLWSEESSIEAAVALRLDASSNAPESFTPIPGSAGAKLAAARTAPAEVSAQRLDLLRGVEMDVTAEIGRTKMTVSELLSLRDGAVVELDRPAGAPADLLVNGRLIARGEVVVIDENFGLRITEIVSDETGR
ncbi:flagellar motor switch protein FliN/FliY [Jatrophihabitans sp. GAS493]|uniref:flagellar motor switch protein FliN n=1 Tax=Jatrophihabitans sp. GAS493 TaxID=1907575 RepID=UPI000BB8EDF8|nr:flagellar motor switch protein FliN [Jatrophihabitans sp. GAS493]SOD71321.1 flagellar motor switch protein FliN/FliY [Jatrophihabitans sp. GAS493]